MGLFDTIRAGLAGIINVRGTLATPTGTEIYPTFIAGEGAGGCHGYQSILDMRSAPLERLWPPMLAVVNDSGIIKTFRLKVRPTTGDYTLGILQNYLNFWEEDGSRAIVPIFAYRRTNLTPSTPTGMRAANFNLYNDEVPLPSETTWFSEPPGGNEDLWISRSLFKDSSGAGLFTLQGVWSTPAKVAQIVEDSEINTLIDAKFNIANYYTKVEINSIVGAYETIINSTNKILALNDSTGLTNNYGALFNLNKAATNGDLGVSSKTFSTRNITNSSIFTKKVKCTATFALTSSNRGNIFFTELAFSKDGGATYSVAKTFNLTMEDKVQQFMIQGADTLAPFTTLTARLHVSALVTFDISKVADIELIMY